MTANIYHLKDHYRKSVENEKHLELTSDATRLSADEALVNVRKNLIDKYGDLDLTDKKRRKYFSEEMANEFYKSAIGKVKKELGLESQTGKGKKPSSGFIDMILESYHGLTRDIISDLVDQMRDPTQFVNHYINRILPQHIQKLEQNYRIDAHKHLKDSSKEERVAAAKKAGLDKILDDAGFHAVTHERNYSKLGHLLRQDDVQGGLSKEYMRTSSEFGSFVKEDKPYKKTG